MLNTALDGSGMQSEGTVNLKIAKSARVEITEYGTLHLTQGNYAFIYFKLIQYYVHILGTGFPTAVHKT